MTQSCFFPRSKRNFKITWHFVTNNLIYTLFLRFHLFFLGLINSVILSTFLKLRTDSSMLLEHLGFLFIRLNYIRNSIIIFFFTFQIELFITQLPKSSSCLEQYVNHSFNQVFISFLNTFWAQINSFSSNLNPFRKLRDNSHFRRKIPLQ